MSFQPIPDRLVRALAYVNIANRGGTGPTADELDTFVDPPASIADMVRASQLVSTLQQVVNAMAHAARQEGSASSRMWDLGWLEERSEERLHLTDLGRAVLRGLRLEETRQAENEPVVIRPDDPLQYATLTRVMAESGAGLLCDPYFKPDMLQWLCTSTSIRRVLVKRARGTKASDEQRQLFPVFLGAPFAQDADVEVRITDDGSFHDRGLVAEDGKVSLLGTSLTGIGTHLTAVTPLTDVAGRPWREHVEQLWEAAEKVEPVAHLRGEMEQAVDVQDSGTPVS